MRDVAVGSPIGILCPHCGRELEIPSFPSDLAVLLAIRMRARSGGTELECPHCGASFMYHAEEPGVPPPAGWPQWKRSQRSTSQDE